MGSIKVLRAIDSSEFFAHPSSLHKIMGSYKSHMLTEKQNTEYFALLEKQGMYEIQGKVLGKMDSTKLKKYESKIDAQPTLSQGAKTHCKEWLNYRIFNDKIDISSRQTDKGNANEKKSLRMLSRYYNTILKDNKDRYVSEFCSGEVDSVEKSKGIIYDIKNPYTSKTFPMFNKVDDLSDRKGVPSAYYWQAQGYFEISDYIHKYRDFHTYRLCYTLTDTPVDIIEREAKFYCRKNNLIFDNEVLIKFEAKMTYSDIPERLKIKVFQFERNDDDIKYIQTYVRLCRAYIDELIDLRINELI